MGMVDSVFGSVVQFATILAASMAATEWFTIPIGREAAASAATFRLKNGTRKPLNAFVYSMLLGALGVLSKLIVPPSAAERWYEIAAFVVLSSFVTVVIAFAAVKAKKLAIPS